MFKLFKDSILVRPSKSLIIICLIFFPAMPSGAQPRSAFALPKYVFLFLSDGGGMTHLEIARRNIWNWNHMF